MCKYIYIYTYIYTYTIHIRFNHIYMYTRIWHTYIYTYIYMYIWIHVCALAPRVLETPRASQCATERHNLICSTTEKAFCNWRHCGTGQPGARWCTCEQQFLKGAQICKGKAKWHERGFQTAARSTCASMSWAPFTGCAITGFARVSWALSPSITGCAVNRLIDRPGQRLRVQDITCAFTEHWHVTPRCQMASASNMWLETKSITSNATRRNSPKLVRQAAWDREVQDKVRSQAFIFKSSNSNRLQNATLLIAWAAAAGCQPGQDKQWGRQAAKPATQRPEKHKSTSNNNSPKPKTQRSIATSPRH